MQEDSASRAAVDCSVLLLRGPSQAPSCARESQTPLIDQGDEESHKLLVAYVLCRMSILQQVEDMVGGASGEVGLVI